MTLAQNQQILDEYNNLKKKHPKKKVVYFDKNLVSINKDSVLQIREVKIGNVLTYDNFTFLEGQHSRSDILSTLDANMNLGVKSLVEETKNKVKALKAFSSLKKEEVIVVHARR